MRRLQIAAALAATLAVTTAAQAQTQISTLMGGSGGSAVRVDCGDDRVLVGVTGRAGAWLDNLFLRCARVSGASLSDVRTLDNNVQRIGGLGGFTHYTVQCPSGQVVKGVMVYQGSFINRIGLYCRVWDGNGWTGSGNLVGPAGGVGGSYDRRDCEERSRPVVALYGREGNYVDALGIICRAP
jgi:hypothetical protein